MMVAGIAGSGQALAAPEAAEPLAGRADLAEPMAPDGNPGSWATNDDYPTAAMLEGREGTSGFRLTIDSSGKPTGCVIVSASGHADLDDATCRLVLARARFKPGTDARGKPVGGTYTNRIRWQIPEGHRHFPDDGGVGLNAMLEGWPRPALPTPAMATIKPADHYPAAALAAREEGEVRMMLSVDVNGAVTDCMVTGGSGSDSLDDAACALMRREAKFVPALDGLGKPTAGRFVMDYQWKLPATAAPDEAALTEALGELPKKRAMEFPMAKPGSATLSILVNADGSIGDCRFEGAGAMDVGAISPCDMFGGKNVYAPLLDDKGNPVARRVTLRTDLKIEDVPEAAAPAK